MLSLLARLVHLGGLLNGSKTLLGIISVAVALLQHFKPGLAEIVVQILGYLGVSLLPIGLADKVRKSRRTAYQLD